MRIMGIDYGERRIGVALCDELGIAAHGMGVIKRDGTPRDLATIAGMIQMYQVEMLVVGFPFLPNGEEGIQCQKVNDFIAALVTAISVPIIKEDETCTTCFAQEVLAATRTKLKKRREVVDQIAAAVILQSYLDRMQRKNQREQAECT